VDLDLRVRGRAGQRCGWPDDPPNVRLIRCARRHAEIRHFEVAVEDIARLAGHAGGSEVTETVYRKQIRPVLLEGAEAMDRIFPGS
jgi:hypothetical protein